MTLGLAGSLACMRRICVFCGSSPGSRPEYTEATVAIARLLASRGIGLVYGGASVGLMGRLADTALKAGGEVIGVIPEGVFPTEIPHTGLTERHVVATMHERKALMGELSDGFIALPGGSGTLEELFEVFTWTQLGIHAKGCVLLNVCGYYDGLIAFLDHAVEERFLRPQHREMMMTADSADGALAALEAFEPPTHGKWLDRDGPKP